jgi:hypothetical protein
VASDQKKYLAQDLIRHGTQRGHVVGVGCIDVL